MAVTFRTFADHLRELLADVVGTLPNGEPAVWVEPPPIAPDCTGLQVVINRYSKRVSNKTNEWNISVLTNDLTNSGLEKLDKAIELIRQAFPVRREKIPVYSDDKYPQATFLVQTHASYSGEALAFSTSSLN